MSLAAGTSCRAASPCALINVLGTSRVNENHIIRFSLKHDETAVPLQNFVIDFQPTLSGFCRRPVRARVHSPELAKFPQQRAELERIFFGAFHIGFRVLVAHYPVRRIAENFFSGGVQHCERRP